MLLGLPFYFLLLKLHLETHASAKPRFVIDQVNYSFLDAVGTVLCFHSV